ncbi:restriction endonuclease subunit R, partial [Halolamina salina]
DTIAQRIEARKQAVRILQNGKEDISERVAEVLVNEVGDTLAQEIEAESKEFVDSLIESLGTDREADVRLAEPASESNEPVEVDADEGYKITLLEDGDTFHVFTDDQQADAMADAIDFLIQEFDLIDELAPLPYVPGEKNAILNSEPRHPSGEEMRLYRELSGDYYLYVALNQISKKRYVERFAGFCGLDAEFEGE